MAAAGTKLFEQYAEDVYGWAYRLLGHHQDALDVVQDVFLPWARQCSQRPPDQPRSWLRRVTLNRAIDVRRHAQAAPAHADAPVRLSATTDSATETIDKATLRDDIASALDRLTDVQRGVLVAKVYEELTFREIAEEFNLAISTVKTHYLRAVRAVRDRLRHPWQDEVQP